MYYAALLVIMGVSSTWCGVGVNWPILSEILGAGVEFFFGGNFPLERRELKKDLVYEYIWETSNHTYIHNLRYTSPEISESRSTPEFLERKDQLLSSFA